MSGQQIKVYTPDERWANRQRQSRKNFLKDEIEKHKKEIEFIDKEFEFDLRKHYGEKNWAKNK